MAGSDEGAWSRALMASSGIAVGGDAHRHLSPEAHEAAAFGLTVDRLRQLAVSREVAVREAIARRDDCPMGVLATLAHDRSDDVRVAAAANTVAVRAVLEHLARDRNASVVKAVARNASTPREIVEALAFHKREEVRRVASRVLDELAAPSAATGEHALPAEIAEQVPAAAPPPRRRGDAPEPAPTTRAHHEPTALAPRPAVGRRHEPAPNPQPQGWVPRSV